MSLCSPGWPPISIAECKFEPLGLLFAASKCWDHSIYVTTHHVSVCGAGDGLPGHMLGEALPASLYLSSPSFLGFGDAISGSFYVTQAGLGLPATLLF